jgi:hypothetical protein
MWLPFFGFALGRERAQLTLVADLELNALHTISSLDWLSHFGLSVCIF